jgi:hypothetical protein
MHPAVLYNTIGNAFQPVQLLDLLLDMLFCPCCTRLRSVLLQLFHMFIASMTTYRPLLLRIKQAYDTALEDAAGSAYDHVHLQTELSLMPQRHVGCTCRLRAEDFSHAASGMDWHGLGADQLRGESSILLLAMLQLQQMHPTASITAVEHHDEAELT